MKRIFCLILALLIVWPSGLAHASVYFTTEISQGPITSVTYLDDRAYVLTGDKLIEVELSAGEETVWQMDFTSLPEQRYIYLDALVAHDGEIYAFGYAYEKDEDSYSSVPIDGNLRKEGYATIAEGGLYKLSFFVETHTVEVSLSAELDVEAYYEDFMALRMPMMLDGTLLGATYKPDPLAVLLKSYEPASLVRFDLTTGEYEELTDLSLITIGKYSDSEVLLAEVKSSEEVRVSRMDIATREISEFAILEVLATEFGHMCYDAQTDTLYFVSANNLYAFDGETQMLSSIFISSNARNLPHVTSEGDIVLADYHRLAKRNLTGASGPRDTLRIYSAEALSAISPEEMMVASMSGAETLGVLELARNAFIARNVNVIIDPIKQDIAQLLLTQSAYHDIYFVRTNIEPYGALLSRGYMADIADESLIAFVAETYPQIQKIVTYEDTVRAIPMSITFDSDLSYSPDAFEALGVKKPGTWPEMLAFLQELPEQLKGTEMIAVSAASYDVFRKRILENLIVDWLCEATVAGAEPKFATDEFLHLMSEFEKIDFNKLGLYCGTIYRTENYYLLFPESYREFSPEAPSQLYFVNGGAIMFSSLSIYSDALPLLIPVRKGAAPVLRASLIVAFVNPYSEHPDIARAFLAESLKYQDMITVMQLSPGVNEPLRVEFYDKYMDPIEQHIEELERQLSELEEDELELQEELKMRLGSTMGNRDWSEPMLWSANEASIAQYRELAQYMVMWSFPYFESAQFSSLVRSYFAGQLDAKGLAERLDPAVYMMREESE